MTPSRMRGVLNDAVSIYFADAMRSLCRSVVRRGKIERAGRVLASVLGDNEAGLQTRLLTKAEAAWWLPVDSRSPAAPMNLVQTLPQVSPSGG